MRRDWGLVRQILLFVEQMESHEVGSAEFLKSKEAGYQIELLGEAGFAAIESAQFLSSSRQCLTIRLTWEGQEFLELIKPDWLWCEICQEAERKELPFSLEMIRQIAERLAQERLANDA